MRDARAVPHRGHPDIRVLRGRRTLSVPILVTCEHGGHQVPRAYRSLFTGAQRLLASHRGWDRGAFDIAEALALALGAPLIAATTTRLLIDLNRSPGHPAQFGARVRGLPSEELQRLEEAYYDPYRRLVANAVGRRTRRGRWVHHLSMHSFAPVLRGERRNADIALLYDPRRGRERAVATAILAELGRRAPDLRLRRNYPYLGRADSLTAALRREHGARWYAGLEVEVNQRLVRRAATFARVRRTLVEALEAAVRDGMLPDWP
jgi:predicted N-formylglutamate amidohydrolase